MHGFVQRLLQAKVAGAKQSSLKKQLGARATKRGQLEVCQVDVNEWQGLDDIAKMQLLTNLLDKESSKKGGARRSMTL